MNIHQRMYLWQIDNGPTDCDCVLYLGTILFIFYHHYPHTNTKSYLPCKRSFLRDQMLKCYQGFQTGWSVLFDLCFLCREPRTQQWILNAIFVYFINVFSAVCHELQMKHFQSVNHRLLQAWPFNYIYEKIWSKQGFS